MANTVSRVLRRSWPWSGAIGASLALLAVSGPAWSAAPGSPIRVAVQATAAQIVIEEHKFSPDTVTVPVGAKVTWVNHDDDLHTATSKTGAFASPGLQGNEAFSFTFNAPGTYEYFCAVHPDMTARIIVK